MILNKYKLKEVIKKLEITNPYFEKRRLKKDNNRNITIELKKINLIENTEEFLKSEYRIIKEESLIYLSKKEFDNQLKIMII